MKTIEEIKKSAMDVADELCCDPKYKSVTKAGYVRGYKQGYEDAYLWNDPKDELPRVGSTDFDIKHGFSEDVIAKSGTAVYIGHYNYHSDLWTLKGQPIITKIIGWRYIESK